MAPVMGCLLALLIAVPSDLLAKGLQVADGGAGVHQVAGGYLPGDRKTSAPEKNLPFSTGNRAILDVLFPNGMNWHLAENSRLNLISFSYQGMQVASHYVPAQWTEDALKRQEMATMRERSPSLWQARLDSGRLLISALTPGRQSRNVIYTDEAELDLRVVSAVVSRDPDQGTTIDVLSGEVTVTLSDGRTATAGNRIRLVITPGGQILRGRVEPGTALLPDPAVATISTLRGMPHVSMPDITLLVSPSS